MGERRRTKKKAPGPWKVRIQIAPGLESALVEELAELRIESKADKGAAVAQLDASALQRVHTHSRIASRMTVHLATVGAQSLQMLADRVRKLPWSVYVHPGQPIEVRVTTHQSRLRNRNAIMQKVQLAIGDALRGPRRPGPRAPREPAIVFLRIDQDKATVQIDASGELLHKRGWRRAAGQAPIRENLAAAALRLAGWTPGTPLVDPMCGSGTFVIEASQWAQGVPCGSKRSHGFQRWPCWSPLGQAARSKPTPTLIVAADRDARRVQDAQQNARRADVHKQIQWHHRELEQSVPPEGQPGLVMLNPPWGERIGTRQVAAELHTQWSRHLRDHWPDWSVAVIVPDAGWCRKAWTSAYRQSAAFSSGGQRVILLTRPALVS